MSPGARQGASGDGLSALFQPRSVAVIGASATPGKAGNALLRSLRGFGGEVFAVNPGASGEIEARAAVRSLAELGRPVDLAILAIPAPACPAALAECAKNGTGAAIVCSGGMGETGAAGADLERRLVAAARQGAVRVLGPNTSGLINPVAGLCASFVSAAAAIEPGRVGLVARSGGVNHALAFALDGRGFGVRLAVGIGNGADVDEAAVVRWLATDDATAAIALHIEGPRDGRELHDAVAFAAARKPVVALKVGRTDVDRLARSHTGAMTGSYMLARAALTQAGAVVVDDSEGLLDAVAALSQTRLPASERPGVGLISGQAGPALLLADALQARGGELPALAPATGETLERVLGSDTFAGNPVDTGRPVQASFVEAARALGSDPSVDLLVAYALEEPEALDAVAAAAAIGEAIDVPLLYASGGPADRLRELRGLLEALGVPMFDSPEAAAQAAAALADDARGAALGHGPATEPRADLTLTAGRLDEHAAKELLESWGVARPPGELCGSHAEAHAALARLGAPVVAKRVDPRLEHKTEAGAVRLGIGGERELDAALDALDEVELEGPPAYLIERELEAGVDLIVGASRDPAWGPTVLVGLGGVAVEALGDVAVRLAPLGRREAEAMLGELGAAPLLDGHRGMPAVDRVALAEVIVLLGDALTANPELRELELNPLRGTPQGLVCLDALFVLAGDEPEARAAGASPR